jgi:hypothetical protein
MDPRDCWARSVVNVAKQADHRNVGMGNSENSIRSGTSAESFIPALAAMQFSQGTNAPVL